MDDPLTIILHRVKQRIIDLDKKIDLASAQQAALVNYRHGLIEAKDTIEKQMEVKK